VPLRNHIVTCFWKKKKKKKKTKKKKKIIFKKKKKKKTEQRITKALTKWKITLIHKSGLVG